MAHAVSRPDGGLVLSVTTGMASAGVGDGFQRLCDRAEDAMLSARAARRDGAATPMPPPTLAGKDALAAAEELRGALERGEFVLYYQPQVDLRSGAVIGAEALIRWAAPGTRPAAAGSPSSTLAERTGMIVPIGHWVLEEACREAARWRAAGYGELVVAVEPVGMPVRDRHAWKQRANCARALRFAGRLPRSRADRNHPDRRRRKRPGHRSTS